MIIEKPFGRDLATRARAQRTPAHGVHRGADLSHRPLPRQGDRAEPAGLPLRQRDLRADVEPAVHRPRADHRRRGDRRRGSRRVLRGGRRAARHRAEPHHAAGRHRRHGGAVELPGGDGSRREGEAAPRRAPDPSRRRAVALGARPVRGGMDRRRARARVSRGARRRTRTRCARRSSRSRSISTTGAGRERRSTCAPASGCRSAPPRSSSSSGACPHSPFAGSVPLAAGRVPDRRHRAQPARPAHSAGRGHHACGSAPRSRARRCASSR